MRIAQALVLVIALIPSVRLDAQQSEAAVHAAYAAVRAEVCTAAAIVPCPAGFDRTEPQRVLVARYCSLNPASPACAAVALWTPLPTLELDHVSRSWTATGALAGLTEKDVNGIPTVSLARRQDLITMVVNTNPLLYAAAAGEIKQENIEQLADLQKLGGLLGTTFAAVLPGAAIAASGDPFEVAAKNLSRDVAPALQDAQCLGDALGRQAFAITSFIQSVEVARPAQFVVTPPSCAGRPVTSQSIRDFSEQVFASTAVARSFCPTAIDAAVALLEGDEGNIDSAAQTYFDAAASPHCVRFAAPLVDDQGQPILSLRAALQQRVVDRVRNAPAEDRKAVLKAAKEADLAVLKRLKGVVAATIDASTKLIATSGVANKAAVQIDRFRARLLQNVLRPPRPCDAAPAQRCIDQEDIARFIVVPNGAADVRWDKVNVQPVKLVADSPFASDVVATRASPVETSFRVRSSSSRAWDLGAAVTATRLKSPTFGAQEGKITITDEESRAGNLALMFNYLPLRSMAPSIPASVQRLGLQAGAALDTKKPAFFLGLSCGLGPYIRLGWGGTSQRVNELRGQSVGEPVASKDAIRTRQGFAGSHYWSLTISIDTLRFFSN